MTNMRFATPSKPSAKKSHHNFSQLVAENAEYERAVASTLNAYLGMPVGQYLDRLTKRLPKTTIEIAVQGLIDLKVARAEPTIPS